MNSSKMFGDQKLIRIKSLAGDGAVSTDTVAGKAGFCRDHLTESGLRSWGPLRPLSRYLGSGRNSAQSSPPHTTSREPPCAGCCLDETTWNTEDMVRKHVDTTWLVFPAGSITGSARSFRCSPGQQPRLRVINHIFFRMPSPQTAQSGLRQQTLKAFTETR